MKKMSELQIGDEVVYDNRLLTTISKVHKKSYEVASPKLAGVKFGLSGKEVGGGKWNHKYIRYVTTTEAQALRIEWGELNRKKKAIEYLKEVSYIDLTSTQLFQIVELCETFKNTKQPQTQPSIAD